MRIKPSISASLLLSVGMLLGGLLSDYATITRFPYKTYIVELDLSTEKNRDFMCSKFGAILGSDVSRYDVNTDLRIGCTLLVAGYLQDDGTLVAYPSTYTWSGRLTDSDVSVPLTSSILKSVKEY